MVLRVALEVSMLICLNEFAAAARIRKLAGKTYVMISRPLPAAYSRLHASISLDESDRTKGWGGGGGGETSCRGRSY